MNIKTYRLSPEADQDIENIFDYTESEFGFDQAVNYVSDFKSFFMKLIDNPQLGRDRSEIKPGLRSFPKLSHIIFYRIMEDHIRIVRVLHGTRDIKPLFDK